MVPEGWREEHLSVFVAQTQLGTTERGIEPGDQAIPLIKMGNLDWGELVLANIEQISKNKVERSLYLQDGDLLFNTRNTPDLVGKTAVWKGSLGAASFDNNINRVRFISDVDPHYACYFLSNGLGKRRVRSLAAGSTSVAAIYWKDLSKLRLVLPPLSEQKKIAEILSTWDKAIETTEKLLANAETQKRALMQQLLTGKKRLKGFSGAWVTKPLAEISTRIQRKTDGEEHPILTISSTVGFVRQDAKYSRYMAGKSVENYVLLRRGEFAYNKGNSKTFEFGCVFDLNEFPTGLVPHVYVCFHLKEGLSHRFFKALFAADYLRPQLGRLVNTGVRNNGLLNISPSQFLTTEVPVPSFAEQEALGSVLEEAATLGLQLRSNLNSLKQEKTALMQQLLTGKRRVREHNHSPEFFRLLSCAMPGWETIKSRLDHDAEIILND